MQRLNIKREVGVVEMQMSQEQRREIIIDVNHSVWTRNYHTNE